MKSQLAVACCLSFCACDLIPEELTDAAALPPLEALVVPKPGDARSSTVSQGACADGTAVIDALEVRVDELNAAAEADLALLRALYEATPQNETGVTRFEVEEDGRTLQVELVSAGGEVAISASVTDDIDTRDLISGAYAEDGAQGALSLSPADGEEIASAWQTADGEIQIARTEGEVASAVDISGDRVRLAITSGADVLAAVWDRDSGKGAAAFSGDEPGCFDAGADAGEICDITCDDEALAGLED